MKNKEYRFYKYKYNFNERFEKRKEYISLLKNFFMNDNFYNSNKIFYQSVLFTDLIIVALFTNNVKEFEISYEIMSLIVLACLMLSYKFHEIDPSYNILKIKQFSFKEIYKYEELCCKMLMYKLDYSTAFDYLQLLLNNGIVLVEEFTEITDDIYQKCYLILDNFINNDAFCKFPPFSIALACVYLARDVFNLDNDKWILICKEIYHKDFEDFIECYQVLKE